MSQRRNRSPDRQREQTTSFDHAANEAHGDSNDVDVWSIDVTSLLSQPRSHSHSQLPAQPSWTRKYLPSQVGLASPSPATRVQMLTAPPPMLDPSALMVSHPLPFNSRVNHTKPNDNTTLSDSLQHKGRRKQKQGDQEGDFRSGPLLPAIRHNRPETTEAESKQAQHHSSSSTALVPAQRHHHSTLPNTASTSNLVLSFHAHHSTYHLVVTRLSHALDSLLDRTRLARTNGQLSREVVDGCVDLLQQLASASPHSSTFCALVSEFVQSVYNRTSTSVLEFSAYDPHGRMSFWQLHSLLQGRISSMERELHRAKLKVKYYETHERGEKRVLIAAVNKWQVQLKRVMFQQWSSNVARIRKQRETMHRVLEQMEQRRSKARCRMAFFKWKLQRIRTRREQVGPQLVQLAQEVKDVDDETAATNAWINSATNALRDLASKLQGFQAQKSHLNGELSRLQNDINQFKGLKLQDIAQYTLDLSRELLLSLQDEVEFYLDGNGSDSGGPFQQDGFLILETLQPPKKKEKKINKDKETMFKDREVQGSNKKKQRGAGGGGGLDPANLADDKSTTHRRTPSSSSSIDVDSAATPEPEWDPRPLESRFASLSDCDILLLWFNYHLHHYHYRPVPAYDECQPPLSKRLATQPPYVQNFSSDLAWSRSSGGVACLLMLLERIAPSANHQQSMNFILNHEFEVEQRVRSMAGIVADFSMEIADMMGLETILMAKAPDMMAAMLAKLFCQYPRLDVKKNGLKPCLEEIDRLKVSRRSIAARLSVIRQRLAEIDAIYANERNKIHVSNLQAARYAKNMNRTKLLRAPHTKEWDEQEKEEEEKRRAEERRRVEEEKRIQAQLAAARAAEEAKQAEAIRRAKAQLGFNVDIDDGNSTKDGEGGKNTKKSRQQLALEHQRKQLREEAERASVAKAASALHAQQQDGSGSSSSTGSHGAATKPSNEIDPFSPEEAQVYVDWIQQFARDFHQLYTQARKHIDRIRRGEQMYQLLQRRMEGFVLDVLVRRANQDPLPIIDHKAHRDWLAFTRVSSSRLAPLLPTSSTSSSAAHSELQLLECELMNDYHDLISVFRAYSRVDPNLQTRIRASSLEEMNAAKHALAGCLMMSLTDFTEFTKDCRLQSRSIKQSQLDEIFEKCTEGSVLSRVCLSPNQFVEAIIRLAALKYPLSSLADSLSLFLKQDVKRCKRISPDLLRSKLACSEYFDLLRKHRRKLRKVFTTFCSGSGVSNLCSSPHSAERHTIDFKDFTNMIKMAKLVGGENLSLDDVQHVFVNTKRSDYICVDNPPTDPEMSRLDYGEYCQALVEVALYKNPDPFTPFFARIDHFLQRDFMPTIK